MMFVGIALTLMVMALLWWVFWGIDVVPVGQFMAIMAVAWVVVGLVMVLVQVAESTECDPEDMVERVLYTFDGKDYRVRECPE